MRYAVNIFLSSGAYEAAWELLIFPHKRNIKRFFKKIGTRGSIDKYKLPLRLFLKIQQYSKRCKIRSILETKACANSHSVLSQ